MSERAFRNARGGVFRTASGEAVPDSIVPCSPKLEPCLEREVRQEQHESKEVATSRSAQTKSAQLILVVAFLLPVLF
eukprot:CAMPEP_0169265652 /NCGR_PEP_ID=MMETSP1016-20121227/45895_1 /TAXON_ID=342587 /ORGANISM="Karlodinium micrum, Strain CCMP2283" /LENGTH=76 /DNA_ID=CAMNT_0009349339 /DNA_START=302 /DNA_END=529 /DNA_ORIENTATION=-